MCKHKRFRKVDDAFKKCKRCGLFMARRSVQRAVSTKKLPAILKHKILPPLDKYGHFLSKCIINDTLKLERLMTSPIDFAVSVRIKNRWTFTAYVTAMQFDRIFRAAYPALQAGHVKKARRLIYREAYSA